MPSDARDLISRLCTADRSSRLGNMQAGASQVKAHPFFRGINWNMLYHRQMQGPIVPQLRFPGDTRYFEDYSEEVDSADQYTPELYDRYEEAFQGF
jgi:protein kinase A